MVSSDTEKNGELKTIFKNGKFYNETTLTDVREKLTNLLVKEKVNV